MLKSLLFCYRRKTYTIDAVQTEGNLNKMGSSRRNMTIIGNGHVEI